MGEGGDRVWGQGGEEEAEKGAGEQCHVWQERAKSDA